MSTYYCPNLGKKMFFGLWCLLCQSRPIYWCRNIQKEYSKLSQKTSNWTTMYLVIGLFQIIIQNAEF